MSEFQLVIDAIQEMMEDSSLPRNVREKLTLSVQALEGETAVSLRASKALHELEDIADDNNMQPHVRTQIFNVVSLLEMQ